MEQLKLAGMDGIEAPEERRIVGILQDTYEEFGLPERNFQIATEDVRKSYGLATLPT